jgi:hypothetical protein
MAIERNYFSKTIEPSATEGKGGKILVDRLEKRSRTLSSACEKRAENVANDVNLQ